MRAIHARYVDASRKNNEAADVPLVNRSAEGDGWLFKLRIVDQNEFADLMDRDAYMTLIG